MGEQSSRATKKEKSKFYYTSCGKLYNVKFFTESKRAFQNDEYGDVVNWSCMDEDLCATSI